GLKVVGGKGSKSRQTQEELVKVGDEYSFSEKRIEDLRYSSRMTAKVDNTAIQAGYQLYHHCMFVSEKGGWAVVQQGMNAENKMARRYHWLSENVVDFVEEPHQAIVCDARHEKVLDLTSKQSGECKKTIVELAKESPQQTRRLFDYLSSKQKTLSSWDQECEYRIPRRMDWNAVERAYNLQPQNFEGLLSVEGVGPATVRGLALISQLIYGQEPSWKDPVKYSFAFGGKDGVPFPVKRREYDQAIEILKDAVRQSKLGDFEKIKAIKRLST
ncbi:MAG: DUF763 domain-containing protein, partial [Candidatus Altiarchaeales archaeon]|nr:DUF763 domain-containing protein [Candidatus Altiarchaeales archaeon]